MRRRRNMLQRLQRTKRCWRSRRVLLWLRSLHYVNDCRKKEMLPYVLCLTNTKSILQSPLLSVRGSAMAWLMLLQKITLILHLPNLDWKLCILQKMAMHTWNIPQSW
ncbi:unnamed protein product [Musa banksii]